MAPTEQQIGAHEATADRILEVVANLPSSTMPAPRKLSQDLRDRLEDIANHHEGTVPLHGRLFSQGLHHACPRECPYPHESGSKNPMTADQWLAEKKTTMSSSTKETMEYLKQTEATARSIGTETVPKGSAAMSSPEAPKLPGSPAEEFAARHANKKQQSFSWVLKVAFCIAALSGLIAMFHAAWPCATCDSVPDQGSSVPEGQKARAEVRERSKNVVRSPESSSPRQHGCLRRYPRATLQASRTGEKSRGGGCLSPRADRAALLPSRLLRGARSSSGPQRRGKEAAGARKGAEKRACVTYQEQTS